MSNANGEEKKEEKPSEGLSDEKKLEVMESIVGIGEDKKKQKPVLTKRLSSGLLGLSNKLKENKEVKLPSSDQKKEETEDDKFLSSLYEIKEEYQDENNENKVEHKKEGDKKEEDKKEENKKEGDKKEGDKKEEDKKVETKPGLLGKGMRRLKTDGVLPTFSSNTQAAEERRNRLAKRLNKAKQVAKANEEKNKFRKSIEIANFPTRVLLIVTPSPSASNTFKPRFQVFIKSRI